MSVTVSNLFTPTDTSQPLLAWRNVVAGTDIVADSENTAFPASNMGNPSTALRWIALTGGAQTITLTVDSLVDYVAIARHNFSTAGMTVDIEGRVLVTDSFSALAQQITPTDDGIILVRFDPTTLAEVRISLGSGTVFPTASVIFCGKLTIMETRATLPHSPQTLSRSYDVTNGMSENGQFTGRIVKSETRSSSASFRYASRAHYLAEIDPFIEYAAADPFFFVPSPDAWPTEITFAALAEVPTPNNSLPNGEISFELSMTAISGTEGVTANATPAYTLLEAIEAETQETDLCLALDAGDTNSFNIVGGKWLDVSGSSNDFDLGTDATEEDTDPIFVGPAGSLRPSAYWTFPSGPTDLIQLTSATQPAFITAMHKAAATFTMMFALRLTDVTTLQYLFATSDADTEIGIRVSIASGSFGVSIDDSSGTEAFEDLTLETVTVDTWHILGLAIDEAGGAAASWSFNNGSFNTFDGGYTTPSASAATNLAHIANRPSADVGLVSGGRLGLIGAWDRVLTTAKFQSVYELLEDRFTG